MTTNHDRAAEVAEQPMTANEVRAARTAYGLTCAELAHILDVNERTVRRWESAHPALPNGTTAAEIRAIDARIAAIAARIHERAQASGGAYDVSTPPADSWGRTTPGLLRIAAWRANRDHGTRIT